MSFSHELVHIRRFDTLIKLVLTAAVCVHWFNPFVWVMYALANRDIELFCDETVARKFGANGKIAYATMLVRMEETKSGLTPLVNHFSKNAIEERIISIMKMKKITGLSIVLALVLITATTVVFATTATTKDSKEEIMPQGILNNWAVYNNEGKLEYYRTLDENGKEVFLNHIPEPQKGDAKMEGNYFVSEKIACVNGVAGEHKESNGRMAVYTNNGDTWSLKKGDTVTIVYDVKAVEGHEKGQGIQFGYLKDDIYTEYTSLRLLGETSITFCVPEDGEYNFFFINASSDTIYVNSCSISVS